MTGLGRLASKPLEMTLRGYAGPAWQRAAALRRWQRAAQRGRRAASSCRERNERVPAIRRCNPVRPRTQANKRLTRSRDRCLLATAMVDRVPLDQVPCTNAAPSPQPAQRQHPCCPEGRRTRALVIVPKLEWRGRVRPVACGELPVRSWPRSSPATSQEITASCRTLPDKTRSCSDFGTTVLGSLGAPLTFRPALLHHFRQPPSALRRESPPPRSSGRPAAPAWFPSDLFKCGDGFIESRAFTSQLRKNLAKIQSRLL